MVRPIYSRHARQRMEQRNISEQEVESVIIDHHTSYTDQDGNPILIGHPGRRIKVVVRKDSDPPFVITAGD